MITTYQVPYQYGKRRMLFEYDMYFSVAVSLPA